MVSALWKASSEGNLENVQSLLAEASLVEIEVKDHTGVTPLIEAVKNGHVEVARALLDKGADPMNASSQGLPEQHTTDPTILELLNSAKNKQTPDAIQTQEPTYAHDSNMDPTKGYYGPPPGAYYYPGMPVGAPMLPDGSIAYYPPPPSHMPSEHNPAGMPNLPPPEVARMIPCRYYPACRYGSSCIFAHPQTPYLQGPLPPPAQYPTHYDPMAPYPPPTYYAAPPHSFPTSSNGAANAMSPPPGGPPALPHPPVTHARSGSEVMSPVQVPFSPSAPPPPMPYGVVPPMSPTYGHPGQVAIPVPVSIPPLSPVPQSAGGPQSPQQSMYPPVSPGAPGSMPPYLPPRDATGQYVPQGAYPNGTVADTVGSPKLPSAHPQLDGFVSGGMNREPMTHHRRGSARRPSFGGFGRKPPCLFFPVGRCRNGDDCRFPHILPDAQFPYHPPHHPPHFSGRGGHRPRPSAPVNGVSNLEDNFANMAIQDDRQSSHARNGTNGTSGTANSSRSQSTDPGSRKGPQGYRPNNVGPNARPDKKFAPPKPQRVPDADEFPVLTTTTPPLRSPGLHGPGPNGYSGPTAAQVLQAPPPRKDGQSAVPARGPTPEAQGPKDSKVENGPAPSDPPVNKLPISFAAAATVAAPDTAKEVSVSA